MTKTYLKSKTLTVGENLLTRARLDLAKEGETKLNPWDESGATGVNYIACNSAVIHVKNVLEKEGCRSEHIRGEGYIITFPFRCKICHRCYATTDELTFHERSHTDPPKGPTALLPICTKCSRTFGNKKALIAHLEKGCNGLEPQEPAPKPKTVKGLLKAHKDAKAYTILDAPSNIRDRGSMRPSDTLSSEPTEEDLIVAVDEAREIRAKKGTFLDFAKKYAELWNMSDTKVMEIVTAKMEAS